MAKDARPIGRVLVLGGLVTALLLSPLVSVAAVAAPAPLPGHTETVAAARRAADYYRTTYPTTTLRPLDGWSWSTYEEGAVDLWRHTGDARYLSDALAWGASSSWRPATGETNPDTVKSGQVYAALHAVDARASLAPMDAQMAGDLVGMPVSQYDWIDALFMGLPDWALWARRTGSAAYLDKMDALFAWNRDRGGTSSRCAGRTVPRAGLYDPQSGLWSRDCRSVGQVDANGTPVFWGRGNGWVVAAMADVLRVLPHRSARAAPYAAMLRSMAARLAPLQGADGFWRASLLDPALYPAPETSGTALITYALAAGIRAGVLDRATYAPVVARAWHGLATSALQPSGFLSGCQPPGVAPGPSYTGTAPVTAATASSSGSVDTDSPPYCVGAFLMAAAQVAQLSPDLAAGRPATVTAHDTRLRVDLGRRRTIGSVMVVPHRDVAYGFRLDTSQDRVHWRKLVHRTARPGTRVVDVPRRRVRYVRLTVLDEPGSSSGRASIEQLSVYAR